MTNEEYRDLILADNTEEIAKKQATTNEHSRVVDYSFNDGTYIRDTHTFIKYYQDMAVAFTTMPKRHIEILAPTLRKAVIYKEDYFDELETKSE